VGGEVVVRTALLAAGAGKSHRMDAMAADEEPRGGAGASRPARGGTCSGPTR
jgi:hypothetical protein